MFRVILVICTLYLGFGFDLVAPARAGVFLEPPPFGMQLSTELESNTSPPDVSGRLLQNWSLVPRYLVGEETAVVLKFPISFGVSLSSKMKLFLYDFQVRVEFHDIGEILGWNANTGVWIYAPLSRVSRDEDLLVSSRAYLNFARDLEKDGFGFEIEFDMRGWWNKYKTKNYQSEHPQQRSSMHEIPKSQKDDRLNDLFSVGLRGSTHIPLWTWGENRLWYMMDLRPRFAVTYSDSTTGLSSSKYATLFWLNSFLLALGKDFYLDFEIQHIGRFTGPKKMRLFGSSATYYLGINLEL